MRARYVYRFHRDQHLSIFIAICSLCNIYCALYLIPSKQPLQEGVIGLVLSGKEAAPIIPRAVLSPFFIQPIFREDGHFMLVSQFFEPSHFIMAYLEDYKMDPAAAQPLLQFSVFDDYAESKDLTLIRADVLNRGIDEGEGLKVVNSMLANYKDDDRYLNVRAFNSMPDSFDLDAYIAGQSEQWKADSE